MKTTSIYYPKARAIYFYDEAGELCGGMRGKVARNKFWRLVFSGIVPRISFSKKVKYNLEGAE